MYELEIIWRESLDASQEYDVRIVKRKGYSRQILGIIRLGKDFASSSTETSMETHMITWSDDLHSVIRGQQRDSHRIQDRLCVSSSIVHGMWVNRKRKPRKRINPRNGLTHTWMTIEAIPETNPLFLPFFYRIPCISSIGFICFIDTILCDDTNPSVTMAATAEQHSRAAWQSSMADKHGRAEHHTQKGIYGIQKQMHTDMMA